MNSARFNKLFKRISDSESAFREIYEYFLPKIKYRVFSKYGNSVDFEDVAHDVFTRLLSIKDPPQVDNPIAYVYKICDNVALDHLRKKKSTVPLDENYGTSADEIAFEEGEMCFFSALKLIDEDSAGIVRMVLWEGYNLREVSEILGISYGAARQKYSRAVKKLKEKIKV